ncbi:MAG: hypothetical protein U1D30_01680 [Planctomycetota bacterium]
MAAGASTPLELGKLMLKLRRRRFISTCASGVAAVLTGAAWAPLASTADSNNSIEDEARSPTRFDARSGDELQRALDELSAKGGGVLSLAKVRELTCVDREARIAEETSRHALLVPEGVELDLGGSTLLLEMRSNSYGVRLSSRSAIRNGSIKIIRSEGKGSQAIWHSAVSVGAAYDDAGTVAKPGVFSSVGRWCIENLTIDQPFEAACIQLMSEAHHGEIRNIRILDSPNALLGVGLDWGTLGPVRTADELVPRMRELWEKNEIASTHPHHVRIENITVGKFGRSMDGNDAAIRCAGCHHITIRNIDVASAMSAVALFGGDFGFEFAPENERREAHGGYLVENIRIKEARLYGIVMNGAEDNVYRSKRDFGYVPLRDPVHPGLDKPIIRNAVLRGTGVPGSRGVYLAAASGASFENLDIEGFEIGFAVNEWVGDSQVSNCRIAQNKVNIQRRNDAQAKESVLFRNIADD